MLVTFLLALIALLALTFLGRGFFGWVVGAAIWLIGWRVCGIASPLLFEVTALVLTAIAALFGVPAIRRALITRNAMPIFAKVLPPLGDTEPLTIQAGTRCLDEGLCSGR